LKIKNLSDEAMTRNVLNYHSRMAAMHTCGMKAEAQHKAKIDSLKEFQPGQPLPVCN
jgi:hypothetical protein